MKQLFPLAWAGLKSRKRATILLLTTIILSVAFLVIMGIIGTSSLYTLDVQNQDAYGEQQVVAWNLSADTQMQIETSSVWNAIGKMTIYGTVDASANMNTVFGIGTIDEQAMELGHIRLAEGRLPQLANEVVLEKSVYKYIGNQPYAIGDSITLEGKDYTVVGFLENYSAVWQTTYTDYVDTAEFSPVTVSFLLSEEGAHQFAVEAVSATWLLNSTRDSYSSLSDAMPQDTLYDFNNIVHPNISPAGGVGVDSDTLNTISTSILIGIMIMVCMMMVLLNGFLMSMDRRKQQFSLLRCIGATKKQAGSYIFCEGFLLMGIGIPAGLVLGGLLSFGAVKVFAVLNHATILYRFDLWILLIAALVCVICVCIALLIPALRASKSTPIAGVGKASFKRKEKKRKQRNGKLSPFTLMLISMRKSKGKTVLTTMTFALVITIFAFMMLFYLVAYQTSYEQANVKLTIPNSHVNSSFGKGYVVGDDVENDTLLLDLMEDMENVIPIAYQSVKIVPDFVCTVPFEKYDNYLNRYFCYDLRRLGISEKIAESLQSYRYSFDQQQQYGYSLQEYLIMPDVMVMDDNLLQMVSRYEMDGRIDIEAINRGEEIILSMPDFVSEIYEQEGGVYYSSGPLDESAEMNENTVICSNTNWKAGDTLTFTWVENAGDGYQQYSRTVRIGAVLKERLPVEETPFVFGVIVGEQTLDHLGLAYGTESQYLYFHADADVAQTEEEVRQFISLQYPQLNMSTKAELNEYYQQVRRNSLTILSLVIVCLLSLGFLGLVNTVSSRIHSRLHEIGLLRSIGMTKGQVYRMLVYEGAVFGVLSSLLGVAASCWLLPMFIPYWLQTATPLYLALACVVCIALSVLTIFLPARNVLKDNPTEMTRGNE